MTTRGGAGLQACRELSSCDGLQPLGYLSGSSRTQYAASHATLKRCPTPTSKSAQHQSADTRIHRERPGSPRVTAPESQTHPLPKDEKACRRPGDSPTGGQDSAWNRESGRKVSLPATLESSTRSLSTSGRCHLPFLLETFPAEYRTPLRGLERHRGVLATL
jgi:hypothetical protein